MQTNTVTRANILKIVDTMRNIKPAPQSITIKPEKIEITDPNGKLVITANKVSADSWEVQAPAGLLKMVK